MTRRAQKIVGEAAKEVRLPWSGTFHSIANRLIRRHSARLGLDANFSVLDRGDAADLMDVVRHELGLSKLEKRFPRKDTCLAIYSHRVNTQGPLRRTLIDAFPWCAEWEEELTRLYRAYVERKLANQALDYDDLLLYWHAMAADAGARGRDERGVRPHPGRRVPGHQRAAGADPEVAAALGRGRDGGGRRRAVDLLVPRRHGGEHPRLPGAVRAARRGGDARAQLPLDPGRARRRQRADRRGPAPVPQDPAGRARRGRAAALRHGGRRPGAGRLRGRARARGARARLAAAAPGGAVSRLAPQRRARARAGAARHPLRQVRRPEVSRGGARQGPARGAALGRQPEEPRQRVPRPAAAARRGTGDRGALVHALRSRRFFLEGTGDEQSRNSIR